jgi:hypothetical protein
MANPGVELPTAPQADVDLDVRALRTYLALDDDNDPVLVLSDGDNTVVVQFGLGGAWESAIDGALGLNEAALRFAVLLRDRYTNPPKTVGGFDPADAAGTTKPGGEHAGE